MWQRGHRIIAAVGVALLAVVGIAPAAQAAVHIYQATTLDQVREGLAMTDRYYPGDIVEVRVETDMNDPGARIDVAAGQRVLDLRGSTLTVGCLVLAPGADLRIRGDGGLTVNPRTSGGGCSGFGSAGIGVPVGSTLIITGGTVNATGNRGAGIGGANASGSGQITIDGGDITAKSSYGAGIGSGDKGGLGTVAINGGTVTTESLDGAGVGGGSGGGSGTVTITGGTVNAKSNQGAGIGGGAFGGSGTVTIDGGTVDAASNRGSGIGAGDGGSGAVTINGGQVTARSQIRSAVSMSQAAPLRIGADATLILPERSRLDVPDGTQMSNAGVIRGGGTLNRSGTSGAVANTGAILLPTANVRPAEYGFVTGNNFDVQFTTRVGDAPEPVRVFAPTFATGDRTLPLGRWNTSSDATGTTANESTALGDLTSAGSPVMLYQAPDAIIASVEPNPVAINQPVVSVVTGMVGDQEWGFLWSSVGTYAITGLWNLHFDWEDLHTTATLTVTDEITVAPSARLTTTGAPVNFTVTAVGGPIDPTEVTDSVQFDYGDGTTGTEPFHTYTEGGEHHVTAALSSLTATTTVLVADSLRVVADPTHAAVGQPVGISAIAVGNDTDLEDVTADAVITTGPGGTVTGNQVTFAEGGTHTITATWLGLTRSVVVTVTAPPVTPATTAPAKTASATTTPATTTAKAAITPTPRALSATGASVWPTAVAGLLFLTGAAALLARRRTSWR